MRAHAMPAASSRSATASVVSVAKTDSIAVCKCGAILHTQHVRREPFICRQFGLGQHVGTEPRPLTRVLDAENDRPAVARAKWTVRRNRCVVRSAARRGRIAVGRVVRRLAHPLGERVEQRHLERGAAAGRGSGEQRGQDPRVRVHSGGDVGDRDAGSRRRIRAAGDRDEADLALNKEVVRLLLRVRPRRSIAGHVADDEAGMAVSENGWCGPEPLGGARRKVLHEHIRARQEAREHLRALRPLEIERERLLRSIQPDEVAREALDAGVVSAREIAAVGPLDLDDTRAEVGKLPRRKRRSDGLLDRDHGDPFQRQHVWFRQA